MLGPPGLQGDLHLDLALGDADIALEVNGFENISIADLARNIERLDMNFLRRAMAKHEGSGLAILRHPLEIAEGGIVHEQHVERILNLLKISYTHLVLDLSKSLLPTDLMALRMADENDSDDVLGSKEAAFFDPALPGRAVSKTGPGRLVPFQAGYAGGWTSDVPPPPDMKVETLVFGVPA